MSLQRLSSILVVLAITFILLAEGRKAPRVRKPENAISLALFRELEELSRLVAATYCVGNQGIREPFECVGWCKNFENFELIKTWNQGIIDSVSCGYIALAHNEPQRIIVAFRGSNSLSDTIYDLMTQPAEYAPFPLDSVEDDSCDECKVHSGFMRLWNATRVLVNPVLDRLISQYPGYQLVVIGHSLGGALAGLASLEFTAKGWKPTTTTFGEPRFGNEALAAYVDRVMASNAISKSHLRYRRVTHAGDPVPLLPFAKWGWRMHSGEIFIAKESLPAEFGSVWYCDGPQDPDCIQEHPSAAGAMTVPDEPHLMQPFMSYVNLGGIPGFPTEWRLWQILFAHRQYFWRIGLCWDPQSYDYLSQSLDAEILSVEL